MSDAATQTDDTHLQLGFRALSAALREARDIGASDNRVMRVALTPPQAAALIAEISKQPPERTPEVDRAALEAMQAVRALFASRWSRPEMRDARVQLAITDAICRCVPAAADIASQVRSELNDGARPSANRFRLDGMRPEDAQR